MQLLHLRRLRLITFYQKKFQAPLCLCPIGLAEVDALDYSIVAKNKAVCKSLQNGLDIILMGVMCDLPIDPTLCSFRAFHLQL